MSKQTQAFGHELTNLLEKYNIENFVGQGVTEDGNGATIIKGNRPKLLAFLAMDLVKDVIVKVGEAVEAHEQHEQDEERFQEADKGNIEKVVAEVMARLKL